MKAALNEKCPIFLLTTLEIPALINHVMFEAYDLDMLKLVKESCEDSWQMAYALVAWQVIPNEDHGHIRATVQDRWDTLYDIEIDLNTWQFFHPQRGEWVGLPHWSLLVDAKNAAEEQKVECPKCNNDDELKVHCDLCEGMGALSADDAAEILDALEAQEEAAQRISEQELQHRAKEEFSGQFDFTMPVYCGVNMSRMMMPNSGPNVYRCPGCGCESNDPAFLDHHMP